MRRFLVVTAMSLLAACGGTRGENSAEPTPDVAANTVEVGNEAGETAAAPANSAVASSNAEAGSVSPCRVQGTVRLNVEPLRAIGTEPFWSARVEGRCVTYSTPEDQQGTRIWTRYSQGAEGRGVWIGQFNDKPFEMRTRPEPGCSDGMSDNRYPIAVELMVDGDKRRGCAENVR